MSIARAYLRTVFSCLIAALITTFIFYQSIYWQGIEELFNIKTQGEIILNAPLMALIGMLFASPFMLTTPIIYRFIEIKIPKHFWVSVIIGGALATLNCELLLSLLKVSHRSEEVMYLFTGTGALSGLLFHHFTNKAKTNCDAGE